MFTTVYTSLAVDTRTWAARNPRAHLRDPITVEDVLGSGYLAEPMHKLECCLVTDGAGAIVVTSAERARSLAKPPVYVLGARGLRARVRPDPGW